jgi:hypothetical protein
VPAEPKVELVTNRELEHQRCEHSACHPDEVDSQQRADADYAPQRLQPQEKREDRWPLAAHVALGQPKRKGPIACPVRLSSLSLLSFHAGLELLAAAL